jgi:pyruvate/2-oxoglutarate dehydrogenase complex dihydrolipoamide dehydrogenase (E3) component
LFQDLKLKRDAYIRRLNAIYDKNVTQNDGITLLNGKARFVDNQHVTLDHDSETVYTAPHILISTGKISDKYFEHT